MRSIIFSLFFSIIVLMPIEAQAYEVPSISGENMFNETAAAISGGTFTLNPVKIINSLANKLTREIKTSAKYIIAILIIAAISGVVHVLSDSLGQGASEAANFVCFVMMSTAALSCFTLALSYATDVASSVCDFVTKLTPVLVMTLFACGSVVTAAAFEPVLSATVYVITIIIEKCLVPMICFSAVLSIAGNINDKVQISNFCRVLKSVSKWIMVAIITVFTSVSAAYGLSAPSMDAVSAKTVKFAVGSLVPVVGNFLSDTLDTVLSGTRLMKNAVGVAGMVSICVMCLIPVIKIFVIQLLLKAGAALAEPMTNKRISSMLWDISDSVMTIFAVTVMIIVIFLINISVILMVTGF